MSTKRQHSSPFANLERKATFAPTLKRGLEDTSKIHGTFRNVTGNIGVDGSQRTPVLLWDGSRHILASCAENMTAGNRGDVLRITLDRPKVGEVVGYKIVTCAVVDAMSGLGSEPRPKWIKLAPPEWCTHPEDLRRLNDLIDSLEENTAALIHETLANSSDLVGFCKVPASLAHHHSFPGGLLRHTVEVASYVDALSGQVSFDRNVAVAGAILHDVGKAREYSVSNSGRVTRSEDGQYLMHKIIGGEMVEAARARLVGIRVNATAIKHCIVSANGPEYMGLPRRKTPEADTVAAMDSVSASTALAVAATKVTCRLQNSKG